MTEEENVTNQYTNDRQSFDTFATDRLGHDNKNNNDEVEDDREDENNSYLDDDVDENNDSNDDEDNEDDEDGDSSTKKRRKSSISTLTTVTPINKKGKGKSPIKTKKFSSQLNKNFDNVSISSIEDDENIETKNPRNIRSSRRNK